MKKVFKELGFIEHWGTRLKRIINSCKEHGLKSPKIEEKNDFFDIEFYRPQQEAQQEPPLIATDYDRLRPVKY